MLPSNKAYLLDFRRDESVSLSLLAGRIYDDRGNRMLPSHTVKNGVRYRYYVSSATQQKRDGDVGSVSRVPAPEIEDLVIKAVQEFCEKNIGSIRPRSPTWHVARLLMLLYP